MASTEVLCVGDQKAPLQHGGTTFDAFQLLAMSCMSASSKLEAQYYPRGIVHIAPKHEPEEQQLLILNGSDYDLIWTSQSQDRTPMSDTFVKINIFVGDVQNLEYAEKIAELVVGQ
ncbi:hypothetical protein B0A48_18665 [Cryoendolithus antarcticus]|uniref:Uncharacterized protein n=1 Tax=Cryoendolithus antarcticus TaxID=1507870 RepID=A0A1V8S838_9PEZI|nr:hypothetical protein B0A48_18665 [Cryoendolithus antarcticus]